MIEFLKKPYDVKDVEAVLDQDILKWFYSKYESFSPPQRFSVNLIHEKKNLLISSPTGTGKTLSAFLTIINELVGLARKGELENRVYALYISPLRALGNDIKANLTKPFEEINAIMKANNEEIQEIRHAVRSGDSTAYEKQRMNVKTPHILITTPESLAIMLCAPKFKDKLKDLQWVIVDEIHALCENKRGTHLSLSLERLENLCNKPFTRIGLSATIAPLDEVAGYLVGQQKDGSRDCKVVEIAFPKERDLKVIAPIKDQINASAGESTKALYNVLTKIINRNRTTLIFTNTRSYAESVSVTLKNIFANDPNWEKDSYNQISAHHSSLSKEHRIGVEEQLKAGNTRVVVSSTSLELGIDIGSIDEVIQLGSPKSIARCLQRVGRAGHNLVSKITGSFVCPDHDDLIEVAVMLKKSYENKMDRVIMPNNCLDVLAQHIVGLSVERPYNAKEAFELCKQSYPYRNLTWVEFESLLTFLSGSDVTLQEARVYGKIWYDKEQGMFGKKGKLARLLYMSNIGTIPDETKITVTTVDKRKIGSIDESFLEKLKKGDMFVLGGHVYEFVSAVGTKAIVIPMEHARPTVPNWCSEQLPLSFDLAEAVREFRASMFEKIKKGESKASILSSLDSMLVDANGKEAIYNYLKQQYDYLQKVTGGFDYNKNSWIIEYFTDEDGYKMVLHTLYGRRVNDALSRLLAYQIGTKIGKNVTISVSDNCFMLHLPYELKFDAAILKDIDAAQLLRDALQKTELLKRRFRHVATRGLMILKRYKGQYMRVNRQQITAGILLKVVSSDSRFPLLRETYREILEDYFDIKNLLAILDTLSKGEINLIEIDVDVPSPFAHHIIMSELSDIVMVEERKEILRRLYLDVQKKIEGSDEN